MTVVLTTSDKILIFALVSMLAGFLLVLITDPYIRRDKRRILLVIAALEACLIVQSWTECFFGYKGTDDLARTVASICGWLFQRRARSI